tara:strand:- start:348 stop:542 length:195 start_codon:yes stop_codon:yes gene_type:complete
MDVINLTEKLLKNIREQKQILSDRLSDGAISSMDDYRFLVGQIRGLTHVEEEIKATMKGIEYDE